MNLKNTHPQMDGIVPKDDKKIMMSIGGQGHPMDIMPTSGWAHPRW